jgi:hypothetical protein
MMTLDEAVATFERELPGWWYKVIVCAGSAEADCAPDTTPKYLPRPWWPDCGIDVSEARKVDKRFDGGFSIELRHTTEHRFTAAEALMALLEEVKKVRLEKAI